MEDLFKGFWIPNNANFYQVIKYKQTVSTNIYYWIVYFFQKEFIRNRLIQAISEDTNAKVFNIKNNINLTAL